MYRPCSSSRHNSSLAIYFILLLAPSNRLGYIAYAQPIPISVISPSPSPSPVAGVTVSPLPGVTLGPSPSPSPGVGLTPSPFPGVTNGPIPPVAPPQVGTPSVTTTPGTTPLPSASTIGPSAGGTTGSSPVPGSTAVPPTGSTTISITVTPGGTTASPVPGATGTSGPTPGTIGTTTPNPGTNGTTSPSPGTIGTTSPTSGTIGTSGPSPGTIGTGGPTSGIIGTGGPTPGSIGTSGPTPGTIGTSGSTLGPVSTTDPIPGSIGTSGPTSGTVGISGPTLGVPLRPSPSPSPGPADPGWVLPVPDETAIDIKARDDCTLTSALFGALGATNTTKCTPGSSSSSSRTFNEFRNGDPTSGLPQGLVTTRAGAQFCVSHEGADRVAAESTRLSFSSTGSIQRELPDTYDPACDDPYAVHREGCSGPAPTMSFLEDVISNSVSLSSSPDVSGAVQTAAGPEAVASSTVPRSLANCTRKFNRIGSTPRSVAIILLKWDRKYYKTKEECCSEQGNPPGCDCKWSGHSYNNLPPPKAYSRIFTDECDQGPSINRGYYDLSGGRVSFHSKLRVLVPQGALNTPELDNTTATSSSTPSGQPGLITPSSSAMPVAATGQPIETATSYLDPDGVDVYGWATLNGMRGEGGYCNDWCGDAMKQLGVNDKDYNHIMCLQLLASKALCDVCSSDCIGTCPASTGIATGCGCATCYYAWGSQSSCNRPSPPGTRVGMAASSQTYAGAMLEHAGGPFISVSEAVKQFVAHEIGHNMGLTHTGSVRCKVDGDNILREPVQCTPDWYGDYTTFMGSSSSLNLPNALRYKVRWLPRTTLKTHPQGTEQVYTMRASTSRRPSWQASGQPVRWFTRDDVLTVRVRLRNPPGSNQDFSSYTCPCQSGGSSCPASCVKQAAGQCDTGPCCTDPVCADKDLEYLYIELHQPYRDDYESTNAGVAIRMMGDLANCTSTRLVPTHAVNGQASYLLTKPDPTGATPGSKYEDLFRGVRVVLESWNRARATVRIWSA